MKGNGNEKANKLRFPEGFLWGTATSSHQVEGGNDNNDWSAWEQFPGHVRDGSRSGLASDWWQRAEDDLATAASLGQNSHRLSLEWSRLEPSEGAWEEKVVARYRQILTAIRSLGMVPMITFHHFTLPLWLYERGGWECDGTPAHFARYVGRTVEAFGDLCDIWCTINEPMVQVTYGHILGIWPPGSGGVRAARLVLRNTARAHAQAYEIIHRQQPGAMVGYAKQLYLFDPADPRRWTDRLAARIIDHLFNEAALVAFSEGGLHCPFVGPFRAHGEVEYLDFVGVNYYSRSLVTFDLTRSDEIFIHRFPTPDAPFSMEGWGEVYPEGLYRGLKRIAVYGLPIYVTEFGVPDNDDSLRPRFIVEHVAAMHRAIAEGVQVRGAYFWSLVDNFEWHEGWSPRFGLIGLHPKTQERTINQSAHVYGRIARANGLERRLVSEIAPAIVPMLFG